MSCNVIRFQNFLGSMKKSTTRNRRIEREVKTIRAMVKIFCRGHHQSNTVPCQECLDVLRYAEKRIDFCPFLGNKPTCANCTVHCFKPHYRQKVKRVMAFAGPRMAYRHPILTFFHFLDKFRAAPTRPVRNANKDKNSNSGDSISIK